MLMAGFIAATLEVKEHFLEVTCRPTTLNDASLICLLSAMGLFLTVSSS